MSGNTEKCNGKNCEICTMWNDKENMVTDTFTMPKDAYEYLIKNFPDVSLESYPQVKNFSMSSFFGLMILEGIRFAELRDMIENHVSSYSHGLCPLRKTVQVIEPPDKE